MSHSIQEHLMYFIVPKAKNVMFMFFFSLTTGILRLLLSLIQDEKKCLWNLSWTEKLTCIFQLIIIYCVNWIIY